MKRVGPIPWERLTFREAWEEKHRFLDCPRYEECLSMAAENYWDGFSCRECFFFQRWKERKEAKDDNKKKVEQMEERGSSGNLKGNREEPLCPSFEEDSLIDERIRRLAASLGDGERERRGR